jgi:hypothetical protein
MVAAAVPAVRGGVLTRVLLQCQRLVSLWCDLTSPTPLLLLLLLPLLLLQWFCEGERLERLLKRSLAAADELAWKLLRNLATSGAQEVAGRMLAHARGMMALLQVR